MCKSEYFYQTGEEREAILQLEEELLNSELEIPVYFAEVLLHTFLQLTLIFSAVILLYLYDFGPILHSQRHSAYLWNVLSTLDYYSFILLV